MVNSTASTNNVVTTAQSNSAAATSTSSTNATPSGLSGLANQETFLKLFVAQLKNQNPLDDKTTDPTAMISELAQFSQLEQTISIGSNVKSINSALTANSAPAATTTTTTDGTNSAA